LSKDQINAINDNDMLLFDNILASKSALIDSLPNVQTALDSDPTIHEIIVEIKMCEHLAQVKLEQQLSDIKQELKTARRHVRAGNAYYRFDPVVAGRYDFHRDESVPKFIDRQY
jgi:hypothetical protein